MTEQRLSVAEQVFGHNKAPVDEVLKADFPDLVWDVENFLKEAGKMPTKIKTEDDLAAVGNCIVDLRALGKRVEGHRKEEGEPLLNAKRKVDAYFKDLTDRLERAAKGLQDTADAYTTAKAAEERKRREEAARKAREREDRERAKAEAGNVKAAGRAEQYENAAEAAEKAADVSDADLVRTRTRGVTSGAKTTWDFRVDDYKALQASLGPLGPFLARADVEKAIRSVVRIQKDGTELPGVSVFPTTKANFRR